MIAIFITFFTLLAGFIWLCGVGYLIDCYRRGYKVESFDLTVFGVTTLILGLGFDCLYQLWS